jgi:hypothetical protein
MWNSFAATPLPDREARPRADLSMEERMNAFRRSRSILPGRVILACVAGTTLLAGCQRSDEKLATDAVVAAARNNNPSAAGALRFRNVRAAKALGAVTDQSGAHRAVGAGICGEIVSTGEGSKRYFIWEKGTGTTLLADESGVIPLGAEGAVMWKEYCRDR